MKRIARVVPVSISPAYIVYLRSISINMQNSSSTLSMLFRRSAAFLYDCLLLIALFFVITAAVIALNDGQAIQHFLYKVFLFFVSFLFFDWFWRHGGQTLGMRAWRIRVEDENRSVDFKKTITATLFLGLFVVWNNTAFHVHNANWRGFA